MTAEYMLFLVIGRLLIFIGKERLTSNWAEQEMASRGESPTSSDVFGRLIGLRPKQKPKT